MRKLMVVLLGFALFLGACATPPPTVYHEGTAWTWLGQDFYRIVDTEAGVVCWASGRGIFCLPLSQTKLDAK